MGASDVVSLINEQANRSSVLRELEGLLARKQERDLIILGIAGHGAQEDERVKGRRPTGKTKCSFS